MRLHTFRSPRSRTAVASEAVGLSDKVGTLEVGKYADIVIVDGNPLDDIGLLQINSKLALKHAVKAWPEDRFL